MELSPERLDRVVRTVWITVLASRRSLVLVRCAVIQGGERAQSLVLYRTNLPSEPQVHVLTGDDVKTLEPIQEDEVIALFLKSSLNSVRFRDEVTRVLTELNVDVEVIAAPALTDARQNAARRAVIGEFRGFGRGILMFADFPGDVQWFRVRVTRQELRRVLYIDYDYWIELSGGSRSPGDAAQRIRQGITAFGLSNDGFWSLADAVKSGAVFPELILVAANANARLVVIDGHARLTSYALAPEHLPAEVNAIVGYSAGMTAWGLY